MNRKKSLQAKSSLQRRTPLRTRIVLKAADSNAKRKTPRDTGPSKLVRLAALNRDGMSCLRCGVSVIGRPYSIHHRKRRSQGGLNETSNLVTLCGSGVTGCHGHVHSHIAESLAAGWLVSGAGDPAIVPILGIAALPQTAVWLTDDAEIVTEDPMGAAA